LIITRGGRPDPRFIGGGRDRGGGRHSTRGKRQHSIRRCPQSPPHFAMVLGKKEKEEEKDLHHKPKGQKRGGWQRGKRDVATTSNRKKVFYLPEKRGSINASAPYQGWGEKSGAAAIRSEKGRTTTTENEGGDRSEDWPLRGKKKRAFPNDIGGGREKTPPPKGETGRGRGSTLLGKK